MSLWCQDGWMLPKSIKIIPVEQISSAWVYSEANHHSVRTLADNVCEQDDYMGVKVRQRLSSPSCCCCQTFKVLSAASVVISDEPMRPPSSPSALQLQSPSHQCSASHHSELNQTVTMSQYGASQRPPILFCYMLYIYCSVFMKSLLTEIPSVL